jgi:hypothetical protein
MNLMLSATPLGPPPLAPFVPLGMPPTGSFHPPVTTTGIHHPMNLIQKPPTSSQMVHQPALFSQIPGFPNELPLVSAAILGGGMPFSTPMVVQINCIFAYKLFASH